MPDNRDTANTSTDATPLASEQITQPDWFDDISFLRGEINALFARTKGHSLRAKEWHDRGCAILDRIAALSATPAPSDQEASQAQGEVTASNEELIAVVRDLRKYYGSPEHADTEGQRRAMISADAILKRVQ